MTFLLDINVLLALLDVDHIHHGRAVAWVASHPRFDWSSCPITQNGFLRIITQSSYTNPVTFASAASVLAGSTAKTATSSHTFWPDDVSLLDEDRVVRANVLGPNQLTDVYLLALAVKNNGCLVTLDRKVPLAAVSGAEERHLVGLS